MAQKKVRPVKRRREPDWCGWGVLGAEEVLHVGPLPGRKRIALYWRRSLPMAPAGGAGRSEIRPLAYFPDEQSAGEALALIEMLALASTRVVLEREV